VSTPAIATRVIAWVLLIGGAIGSFILAVFLSRQEFGGSIVIASREFGLLENWALALIAVSIGCCVYVLRGLSGGGWSLSVAALVAGLGAAGSLLLFGLYGLLALAAASAILGPLLVMRRRSGI
jgi:hypothetical protein